MAVTVAPPDGLEVSGEAVLEDRLGEGEQTSGVPTNDWHRCPDDTPPSPSESLLYDEPSREMLPPDELEPSGLPPPEPAHELALRTNEPRAVGVPCRWTKKQKGTAWQCPACGKPKKRMTWQWQCTVCHRAVCVQCKPPTDACREIIPLEDACDPPPQPTDSAQQPAAPVEEEDEAATVAYLQDMAEMGPGCPTVVWIPRCVRQRYCTLALAFYRRWLDVADAEPWCGANSDRRASSLLLWGLPQLLLRSPAICRTSNEDAAAVTASSNTPATQNKADADFSSAAVIRRRIQLAEAGR